LTSVPPGIRGEGIARDKKVELERKRDLHSERGFCGEGAIAEKAQRAKSNQKKKKQVLPKRIRKQRGEAGDNSLKKK